MTIDKVICKNFKINPIINYDIFAHHILPYINNVNLNKREYYKLLLIIFKNNMKNHIIKIFGKNYQQQCFNNYNGICFVDTVDKYEDMFNIIIIAINKEVIDSYYLELIFWFENKLSCKNIKKYLKKTVNNFELIKDKEGKYIKIEYKLKNDDDKYKQFQKILMDKNFNKKIYNVEEHIIIQCKTEIDILKSIFLDKILNIFY